MRFQTEHKKSEVEKSESEFTERGVQPVNRSFVRACGRGEAAGAGEGRRVAVSRAFQTQDFLLLLLRLLRPVRGLRLHNYKGKAFQIPRTVPTWERILRTGPILDWCAGFGPTVVSPDVSPMAGQKKSLRTHVAINPM